jgi:DNA polymerase IV (DinB-like DNA polymerase)
VFAESLKEAIADRAGVTASVGVAPNMSAAKLASDHDKPDGLVVVEPGGVAAFLAPLPVEELHGVGPVTARELRGMGITTAGELAGADREVLSRAFGERGRTIHDHARGVDPRPVEPRGDPKSLNSESAFTEATDDFQRILERARELAEDVCDRAESEGALYKTIGVKVVRPPFDVNTRAWSLSGPVQDRELVQETARDLLEEFRGETVRKLGVRVANLSFGEGDQASLDSWAEAGEEAGDAADATEGATGPVRGGQTRFDEFEFTGAGARSDNT